ncbi:uncharacterized protein LOC6547413 [Drosophila erecta]|uniref:Ionotropic glutamate receptor C-terminal domain-containing protein n=1 Tax=Drosophila erecta TaxID=7220 RepID=B3NJN3_DROER|nr:uncharacterized protein LOC6547413 [Drosophila erecta]EDV55229.1 uncharacterized protein Dere_GG20900 [Drosophila erecta]
MDSRAAELILRESSIFPASGSDNIALLNNMFVLEMFYRITQLYHFKNFVFYVSESLDLNNKASQEFFHNFWTYFPMAPNLIITREHHLGIPMMQFISTPSLVMVFTTGKDDPIMEVAAHYQQGIRWLKTIFVLFPSLESRNFETNPESLAHFTAEIKDVYDWVWRQQFINTLLVTIKDNVFILDPYPTPSIVNRTGAWRAEEFFQKYAKNMKGYLVRTPILYDMPRVFKSDRPSNRYERNFIHGTSGNLFLGFLEFVNATLVDTSATVTDDYLNMTNLLDLVSHGVYETLIHSFTEITTKHVVSYSYPIGINDCCIMVPYRNQSPADQYMHEALQENVWILICLFTLYITAAIYLCSPLRPRDLSAAFLQSICTLTYSVPTFIIRTPTLRMRYLYILLAIWGIVTSNLYISRMTSYFTAAPPVRQINSVADVVAANLRLKMLGNEYERMARSPLQYPENYMQQVDLVDKHMLDLHRDPFNTSFGYTVSSDRWRFLNQQQLHLRRPIFRLTDICEGPFYHVFPLHKDSHMRSVMTEYIMIAQHAGLMSHWEREAFWEAVHLHRIHVHLFDEEPMALSLDFFSSVLRTWTLGLILAGLAFAAEMKWHEHVTFRRRPVIGITRKPRSFLRRFMKL